MYYVPYTIQEKMPKNRSTIKNKSVLRIVICSVLKQLTAHIFGKTNRIN